MHQVTKTTGKIIFGGGCFWCLEAVFKETDGVVSVTSGYAQGSSETANYHSVCSGVSEHAEVVLIEYDTQQTTQRDLLEIFFAIHDPTTLNQQGNDIGTQYRSIICCLTENEVLLVTDLVKQHQAKFSAPIVTTVERLNKFYPAEVTHQDYYDRNKTQPYCQIVIKPKLDKLAKLIR
jgi:methionine-S-sulfoxide reductase